MIPGMKPVPADVAAKWHDGETADEIPPYLKPFLAAKRYSDAKLRVKMTLSFSLGAAVTGVMLLLPNVAFIIWSSVVGFGLLAAALFGVLTLRNYLAATRIVADVDRGIKIVDPLDADGKAKEEKEEKEKKEEKAA